MRFPEGVVVKGEPTPTNTGALEVVITNTGETLHSKLGGAGTVDSEEKLEKILSGIAAAAKKVNVTVSTASGGDVSAFVDKGTPWWQTAMIYGVVIYYLAWYLNTHYFK